MCYYVARSPHTSFRSDSISSTMHNFSVCEQPHTACTSCWLELSQGKATARYSVNMRENQSEDGSSWSMNGNLFLATCFWYVQLWTMTDKEMYMTISKQACTYVCNLPCCLAVPGGESRDGLSQGWDRNDSPTPICKTTPREGYNCYIICHLGTPL